jgi:hypothetical protein
MSRLFVFDLGFSDGLSAFSMRANSGALGFMSSKAPSGRPAQRARRRRRNSALIWVH